MTGANFARLQAAYGIPSGPGAVGEAREINRSIAYCVGGTTVDQSNGFALSERYFFSFSSGA
eukprot:4129749-Pyramimonas_sp.AAC.1